MYSFTAKIFKIGINPCVVVPAAVLKKLFTDAGRSKGPIPVKGRLDGASYIQTIVKYKGKWRLYVNGIMFKDSGLKNGDTARFEIAYDSTSREIAMHPLLAKALKKEKQANEAFGKLSPYRRKEIVRYISHLKSEESIIRNVEKAILHLKGKSRFAGRDYMV